MTSSAFTPMYFSTSAHMPSAISTPLALQVLALPLLQMTACAMPVFHVFLRNENRRALDQILRIDAGCAGGYFTDDQGHVAPGAVAPDAHMLARGGEALRGRRCRRR